jgi:hypothetical protein
MTTEERHEEGTPEVQLAGDGPQCGKFVAKDGDREMVCDLPADHPDTTPCSASLERHTV